jgi:hypothetical protein
VIQVVDHLPSKCEALSSNPTTDTDTGSLIPSSSPGEADD